MDGTHNVASSYTISIGTLFGFCKIMDPGEWDTRCGIGLHDIHRFSAG